MVGLLLGFLLYIWVRWLIWDKSRWMPPLVLALCIGMPAFGQAYPSAVTMYITSVPLDPTIPSGTYGGTPWYALVAVNMGDYWMADSPSFGANFFRGLQPHHVTLLFYPGPKSPMVKLFVDDAWVCDLYNWSGGLWSTSDMNPSVIFSYLTPVVPPSTRVGERESYWQIRVFCGAPLGEGEGVPGPAPVSKGGDDFVSKLTKNDQTGVFGATTQKSSDVTDVAPWIALKPNLEPAADWGEACGSLWGVLLTLGVEDGPWATADGEYTIMDDGLHGFLRTFCENWDKAATDYSQVFTFIRTFTTIGIVFGCIWYCVRMCLWGLGVRRPEQATESPLAVEEVL